MSGLSDAEQRAPLESWTEREARLRAERARELAADRERIEHEAEARMARLRAIGCDDGAGTCKFCGILLGTDEQGRHTHPDNRCPGPGRVCDTCGKPWAFDAACGRWNPTCSPAEHEARERARMWTVATAERDPLAPPRRVRRDDDD